MNTQELKIEVPAGYEIDRENSTFENIVFKKIGKELPKSWKDLPFVEGWFVNGKCEIIETGKLITQEYNKNTFPTKEEAEACLALAQLCQLRDIYNEGWKPNWEDYNETKYCIEFCQGRIETIDRVNCHKVLTFKTEELRDGFLENFRGLIKIAKPLL